MAIADVLIVAGGGGSDREYGIKRRFEIVSNCFKKFFREGLYTLWCTLSVITKGKNNKKSQQL